MSAALYQNYGSDSSRLQNVIVCVSCRKPAASKLSERRTYLFFPGEDQMPARVRPGEHLDEQGLEDVRARSYLLTTPVLACWQYTHSPNFHQQWQRQRDISPSPRVIAPTSPSKHNSTCIYAAHPRPCSAPSHAPQTASAADE
jgi:hypothetical protein